MVSMVDLIRAGTKKQGARRLKGCIHALAAVAKQALRSFLITDRHLTGYYWRQTETVEGCKKFME